MEKKDRGRLLLDALTDTNPLKIGLRTNAFDYLTVDEIYHDEGLKKVTDYLERELGTEDIYAMAQSWTDVVNYRRPKDMEISDFVSEVEKRWKAVEVNKCGTVSLKVQALQMMEVLDVHKK